MAAHHRSRQLFARLRIGFRVAIGELPEAAHILLQLPQDQIAAIAAQITHSRLVFRLG